MNSHPSFLFRAFLFYITLLGLSIIVHTTDAGATPKKAKNEVLTPAELLVLKKEIAEKDYELKPGADTRGELLRTLEYLTATECFPKLMVKLKNTPAENSLACKDKINATLELYPDDPIAICARDGFLSVSCRESDVKIVIKGFEPADRGAIRGLDSELKAQQNAEKVKKLTDELHRIDQEARELPSDATPQVITAKRDEGFKVLYQLIALTCADNYILVGKLEELKAIVNPKSSYDSEPPGSDSTAEITGYVRMLPNQCIYYIDTALSVKPNFSSAICAKFGTYSPRCIEALKAAKKERTGGSGDSELGSF